MSASKEDRVFNFYLIQFVMQNITAEDLSDVEKAGKLTAADIAEIGKCTALDWKTHKR